MLAGPISISGIAHRRWRRIALADMQQESVEDFGGRKKISEKRNLWKLFKSWMSLNSETERLCSFWTSVRAHG